MKSTSASYFKSEQLNQFGFLFFSLIVFWIPRESFIPFILIIALIGFFYWQVINDSKPFPKPYFILILISAIASPPMLSNDIYRFLWDGKLIAEGINPHDFKPIELINSSKFGASEWHELYKKMGELSQMNYSCYPFVTEVYSALPAFITDSITFQILILKILFLISGWFAIRSFELIIQELKLFSEIKWQFLLHPLLLIEGLGNLHFEWIMVSFIIIGIRYAMFEKFSLAGLFIGLAIQVKLIPFIILPFFVPVVGWKRSIQIGTIALVVFGLSSMIFIHPSNIKHVLASLQLYYGRFEFNSSIYDLYIQFGYWKYHFYPIHSYSLVLTKIAACFILVAAWFRLDWSDWRTFFKRLSWAFLVYYALSTTIHPWYLIVPILFSVLAGYRIHIWWGLLIFLSYFSYQMENETYFVWIKGIEYLFLSVVVWQTFRKEIVQFIR